MKPAMGVLTVEDILAMQELVRRLPVGDHVYGFAVDLVRRSRPSRPSNGDFINQMVTWGAGSSRLHLPGPRGESPRHFAGTLPRHH